MKVNRLIRILETFDKDSDVQIYILENGGDLVHANIESILESEIGCELTVQKEEDFEEEWTTSIAIKDKYESVKADNADYFVQEREE
tara:strand:- start:201 stop:461 length:261 start_codon:yes stop_codon:yes gene_type:complete